MTMSAKLIDLLNRGAELDEGELPLASRVAECLRQRRRLSDHLFDRFLPNQLRLVSGSFWTPLVVALRVAEWIDELQIRTVVDIGSGAGKFCVAAALASRAQFRGVEHRGRLVTASRELARVFEVEDRVTFLHGALERVGGQEPDAYYIYNPFEENLFGPEYHLDEEVELGHDRYLEDLTTVEQLLGDAQVGTYLVTYNGFGGRIPSSFSELRVDRALPNVLRLWQKTSRMGTGRPHHADAL